MRQLKHPLFLLLFTGVLIPIYSSAQSNAGLIKALASPRTDYRARSAARQEAVQLQQLINQTNAETLQTQMQLLALEEQEMTKCANQVRELWRQYAYPAVYPDGTYKVHVVIEGAACEIKTISVRNNRVIPINPLKGNDSSLQITTGRGVVMREGESGQPTRRAEYYFIYQ